ncbi:MAG: histidine--tRNA ligase [Bacteroidota bacterium]|jgi:histidyl-tRNA synthetase|nr:histidine--tRNA ligase [Bacteroidota bacterium]
MNFKSVKGTRDLLPRDTAAWQHIEQVIREVMELFRYGEIRTPVFEDTAVFTRGIGEETDIVGKEMYTFTDKGGSSLTLRPEMTAPVIRAYIQHALGEQSALNKLYYVGPMFRQERPQAGRFRQFHQFGFECVGQPAPECDVEIIAMAAQIFQRLGVHSTLKINSVGDPQCRPRYRDALQEFLHSRFAQLSPESQRRTETNPMRVLDSKDARDQEATRDAPVIIDYLSEECRVHFERTCTLLDALAIPYVIDPRLVRGLDYYTMTAFEFISTDLGSQDALGGGGRYDGLVAQLGGKATPAVGFAAGIERLMMVMEKNAYEFPTTVPTVFLIGLDEAARDRAFLEAMELRRHGVAAETDYAGRSLKAQMREANRLGCPFVAIIGERELADGQAQVKDMRQGTQESIEFGRFTEYFTTMVSA